MGDRSDGGCICRRRDRRGDHRAEPGPDAGAPAAGRRTEHRRRGRVGSDGLGLACQARGRWFVLGSAVGVAVGWLALIAMGPPGLSRTPGCAEGSGLTAGTHAKQDVFPAGHLGLPACGRAAWAAAVPVRRLAPCSIIGAASTVAAGSVKSSSGIGATDRSGAARSWDRSVRRPRRRTPSRSRRALPGCTGSELRCPTCRPSRPAARSSARPRCARRPTWWSRGPVRAP